MKNRFLQKVHVKKKHEIFSHEYEDMFDTHSFLNNLKPGRLIGIDFGTYKTGIAISDETRDYIFPYETRINMGIESDLKFFKDLIIELKIVGVVIGVSLEEDGKIHNQRLFKKTKDFLDLLIKDELQFLPYVFCDESFSSHESNELMFNYKLKRYKIKECEDKIAACIILKRVLREV
jgi:putative transcription antitermination factor YqgF